MADSIDDNSDDELPQADSAEISRDDRKKLWKLLGSKKFLCVDVDRLHYLYLEKKMTGVRIINYLLSEENEVREQMDEPVRLKLLCRDKRWPGGWKVTEYDRPILLRMFELVCEHAYKSRGQNQEVLVNWSKVYQTIALEHKVSSSDALRLKFLRTWKEVQGVQKLTPGIDLKVRPDIESLARKIADSIKANELPKKEWVKEWKTDMEKSELEEMKKKVSNAGVSGQAGFQLGEGSNVLEMDVGEDEGNYDDVGEDEGNYDDVGEADFDDDEEGSPEVDEEGFYVIE